MNEYSHHIIQGIGLIPREERRMDQSTSPSVFTSCHCWTQTSLLCFPSQSSHGCSPFAFCRNPPAGFYSEQSLCVGNHTDHGLKSSENMFDVLPSCSAGEGLCVMVGVGHVVSSLSPILHYV